MNVLRRCPQLHRSYATQPPLPRLARVARTASTPLAVRLRRRKQFGASPVGTTDATKEGLTPSEQARYTRMKAQGLVQKHANGKELTSEEWLNYTNDRRSRVRGFARKRSRSEGTQETEVLGRKVYLPNIVMRLIRNHTLPGQPYNPYEATFRIPQSVTKTDVRSLLLAIYGVKSTYIRTDNYISPWYRTQKGYERRPYKTYKRAVVGLVDPFYYPHRLEDMPATEKKEREEFIEKHFAIQHNRNLQKQELLRMTMGGGKATFKFKAPYATKRSHIIRLVNERRAQREGLVTEFADEIAANRKQGEKFNYQKVNAKIQSRSQSKKEALPPLRTESSKRPTV